MHFGNRDYELADARFEQERAAGVQAARNALSGGGSRVCRDCEGDIPEARRKALSNAIRCATCQTLRETRR